MDVAGRALAEFMEAIAAANENLVELATTLRAQPSVNAVTRWFDCRRSTSGPAVEGFVDAELKSGQALSWWLRVYWNESEWTIESHVAVVHDQGQDIVQELPTRLALNLYEFKRELASAVGTLTASAKTIDFTTFG